MLICFVIIDVMVLVFLSIIICLVLLMVWNVVLGSIFFSCLIVFVGVMVFCWVVINVIDVLIFVSVLMVFFCGVVVSVWLSNVVLFKFCVIDFIMLVMFLFVKWEGWINCER